MFFRTIDAVQEEVEVGDATEPVGLPAVAAAKKSEIPDLANSKPSFGDKQKPLYHTPLKWRKLVGKPQVRRRAEALPDSGFCSLSQSLPELVGREKDHGYDVACKAAQNR